MNKLILAILLSLSMTAHAQVSGPGNTFGGGGGSVYRFLTSSGDFPRFGECLDWHSGGSVACSSSKAGLTFGSPGSLVSVSFASPGNTAKSSCDVTAIVSVASSGTDTTIGTLVIDVSSSGTSSAGLSRSMNVGDSLKIQIGNGFGDSGCSYLNGVLNVEIS